MKQYLRTTAATMRYAFRFAKKEGMLLILILCVSAVMPYLNFFFLGALVDKVVSAVRDRLQTENLLMILFAYSIIVGIPKLVSAARIYISKAWNAKLNISFEMLILQKRLDLDIEKYEDSAFQNLMKRAFKNNFWPLIELSNGQLLIFREVLSLLLGSVLAIRFGPWVYTLLLVTSIPGFVTEFRYGNSVWTIWAKDTPNQRRLTSLRRYFEHRSHIVETKLLQSGKWLTQWVYSILKQFKDENIKLERRKLFFILLSEAISLVGFVLAAYKIVFDVINNGGAIGNVILVFGILTTVRNSMSEMLVTLAQQYEKHLNVKDILEILNTESRYKKDNQNKICLNLNTSPVIVFESVSFRYPFSKSWSLRDINLTIHSMGKIALIGENGSGKSTLVKLLCRIYDPTEGRILVNGSDLRDIDLEEWWSYLGVMLQDYADYNFVTKDVIAIGRTVKKQDMSEIIRAADVSDSAPFIERWKDQYLNNIGVEFNGAEPSKGQRQKLAIAKIIYRNPFVMVMDEPTASIDTSSEIKIFDAFRALPKHTSLVLITHNLSTVKWCDAIYVFHEGRIIERGTHDELVTMKAAYSKIFESQANRFGL